jgi:hypothetical protein
MKAL